MRQSMTYGILPDRKAFHDAFWEECPNGKFKIENDKPVEIMSESLEGIIKELETIKEALNKSVLDMIYFDNLIKNN